MTLAKRGEGRQKREPKGLTIGRVFPVVAMFGVVITIVVMIIVKGRGPRGTCTFDQVYRRATCKSKELRVIPKDIPEVAIALHMGTKVDKQENYFTVLKPENFTKYKLLQELRLIKCGIENIEPETFKDLISLKKLDLRYNRIETITENTFKGLSNLEDLYLSNNPIHSLGDFVFRGLSIETLVLGNNPALTEISSRAFASATLKSLVMNRCSLSTVKVDTFISIADSLKDLYITQNMVPLVLPENIFKGLQLKILTLTNNGLTDTEFLEGVKATQINLDENPLIEFDCDDCASLAETKIITLSKTKLAKLFMEDFDELASLEELDLDGNDLQVFNITVFSLLHKLRLLDLSNNDIEDVDGNVTAEILPELVSLSLHGNEIETLPSELEPLFSRLQNVTLHDNPLHCNCELRWLAKWLERGHNREILRELDQVMCDTPVSINFTLVSDYGFQCRAPTIFNATFDSDGISLLCTAEGDPAPVVIWVSPDGAERSTVPPDWEKEIFQTRSSLTISKDGNYTCIARNMAGEDRITVNTRKMPSSGLKFHVESQEIEILETPQGLCVVAVLLVILGYMITYDPDEDKGVYRY